MRLIVYIRRSQSNFSGFPVSLIVNDLLPKDSANEFLDSIIAVFTGKIDVANLITGSSNSKSTSKFESWASHLGVDDVSAFIIQVHEMADQLCNILTVTDPGSVIPIQLKRGGDFTT